MGSAIETLASQLTIDKSGWTSVKLGDVVFEPKESVKDVLKEGIEHVVGLEHIEAEDIHLRRSNSIEENTTFSKKFSPGDLLFGRRRAYLKKAAQADFTGICSGDIIVMRAKENLMPELLPFIVNNDKFFDWAITHSAGGLSPRCKFKDLANYEFLLPPKAQQAESAELLWAMDEVIQRELFCSDRLNTLIESIIETNLVASANEETLLDYCEPKGVKIGPFGSLLHASDYQTEGVPVVMPTHIEGGVIQDHKVSKISLDKAKDLSSYELKAGDILFPRRGDLAKRAIVLDHQEGWICGTGTIRVRLQGGVDPKAVFHAVNSKTTNNWLVRFAVGTTMPNLNASTICRIPLHIPIGKEASRLFQSLEDSVSAVNVLYQKSQFSKSLLKSLIKKVF